LPIREQDDFVDMSVPKMDTDVIVTIDAAQVDVRVFKLQQENDELRKKTDALCQENMTLRQTVEKFNSSFQ